MNFLEALVAPVFKLVHILMKAAPIGAFGAIAFTIGKYGVGSLINLAGWWARSTSPPSCSWR